MPTFGPFIRRFSAKLTDLSKMAAHDYEDALQCAIPCFEGIFDDETDREICVLLFRLAMFHGLAKLRMHTDSSVCLLWNATIRLATALRHFRDEICPRFTTVETPSEADKRKRRAAATATSIPKQNDSSDGRRTKKFSLDTYKFHAIGDYALTAATGVTLDSITTAYVSYDVCRRAGQCDKRSRASSTTLGRRTSINGRQSAHSPAKWCPAGTSVSRFALSNNRKTRRCHVDAAIPLTNNG